MVTLIFDFSNPNSIPLYFIPSWATHLPTLIQIHHPYNLIISYHPETKTFSNNSIFSNSDLDMCNPLAALVPTFIYKSISPNLSHHPENKALSKHSIFSMNGDLDIWPFYPKFNRTLCLPISYPYTKFDTNPSPLT